MNSLITTLSKSRLFKSDLDYHLVRASMVFIFLIFGYQKWFQYEADTLIPYISNGPLIFWMYPVFGVRGRVGSWAFRNGCLPHFCSRDSGIRNSAFLGTSVHVFRLSQPSPLSPLCRMAGLRLPAAFPQWLAMLLS